MPDARHTLSLSARGLDVSGRPVLRNTPKLRLRRVVARRNEAVIKYRRLAKASVAEKDHARERFFAEEIARPDEEIAKLQAKLKLPCEKEGIAKAVLAAEQPGRCLGCDAD